MNPWQTLIDAYDGAGESGFAFTARRLEEAGYELTAHRTRYTEDGERIENLQFSNGLDEFVIATSADRGVSQLFRLLPDGKLRIVPLPICERGRHSVDAIIDAIWHDCLSG